MNYAQLAWHQAPLRASDNRFAAASAGSGVHSNALTPRTHAGNGFEALPCLGGVTQPLGTAGSRQRAPNRFESSFVFI
jgi:hypothetical protein